MSHLFRFSSLPLSKRLVQAQNGASFQRRTKLWSAFGYSGKHKYFHNRNRPVPTVSAGTGAYVNGAPGPSAGFLEHRGPGEGVDQLRYAMDNKYLWGMALRHKGHLAIAGIALMLATASNLASPVIVGIIVESLAGQLPLAVYQKYLAILAVAYLAEPLLSRVYVYNICQVAEKVSVSVRQELFRCLLMQKIEFFDRHKTEELTSLLEKDLDSIRSFVFNNCTRDRGIRALLESVGAVTVLFVLSWQLGPLLAAVVLSAGIGAALYKRATKPLEALAAEARVGMVEVASQAFRSIRTVRSFAGEPLERERFVDHCEDAYRSGMGFAKAKASLESINRVAIHVSLLVLYSLGGWLISNGVMSLKTLMAGIGFTFALIFASQGVVNTLSEFRAVQVSLERVQKMLRESSPDPAMTQALPPGAWWDSSINTWDPRGDGPDLDDNAAVKAAASGSLELKDLWFSYPMRPETPVLKDLNLVLERGKVTAIVGRSGSGKSTIAALISKFYSPDKGGVYLGGTSAEEFSAVAWSNAVALVGQEPVLFDGTIFDNIAYGRRGNCTREEVEEAARLANAHEFIKDLPQGYDTYVGHSGGMLSGGQRQRVAIARALCKDSPIIILDEATSALDAASERLVQQAIERLVKGKTVMVIAHRLSTVQRADRICVVDGGRIAEEGSHEELVQKEGIYAKLVDSQSMILSQTMMDRAING
uniref:Abc transporter b family member 28-like n=1 Tax=Tetraselmis sp. GSL018 TaxID=582737 RepID=A0A061QMA6_9CHLO|mmetsp:Transcript_5229/g.12747  ORF Transcript_5229/g.12747 Transcript_5229/m.12747 type:complete len:705 (-) Transcript_5229:256-2370(-)